MSNPDDRDRDSILYAFAIEPTHDRATIERYIRANPELAEELIDLSSELRLANPPSPSPADPDPGLEAAWQEFLACVTSGRSWRDGE